MPATTDVDKSQMLSKTVLQLERDSAVSRAVVEIAREIIRITGLMFGKRTEVVVCEIQVMPN